MGTESTELEAFLRDWSDNAGMVKKVFVTLQTYAEDKGDVLFFFKARPGVSYSLRFKRPGQKDRQLFGLIDVIDDDPEHRWLSVCFYEDLVSDPKEIGNVVPQGILGEDGYCFDAEEWDENEMAYLKERFDEAYANAN
jgi:hypothetical protein